MPIHAVNPPAGETIWISYCKDGHPIYIITSKKSRDCYYLYSVDSDMKFKKIGKATSPKVLEEKYGIIAEMKQ